MRSKIAQRILDNMPEDIKIFTDKYADLVVLISRTLKEKGWTQKYLADQMDKSPSEINKWLSGTGEHNLTLRSIAKLEAELGVTLIKIPIEKKSKNNNSSITTSMHLCPVCLNGSLKPGTSTVAIDRDYTLVIFKQVPSNICDQCNTYILDEKTNRELNVKAKEVAGKGTELEILRMAV